MELPGCAACAQKLPDSENKKSQENKRRRLAELYKNFSESDGKEILALMMDTYLTQRAIITE